MRLTEALVGSRVSHILGIPDPYQTTSTRHISSMEMLRMMMMVMVMMLMMTRRRIIMIFRWTEVAVVMLIINPNSPRDTSDSIMRMNIMIMIMTIMIHLIWWYFEYYDYDYDYDYCDTSDMKMLMIITWDITFLPFPFDISFVAARNWIDNLQEGSCRGLAILSAVKNPGFIRSWGRGEGRMQGIAFCFFCLFVLCCSPDAMLQFEMS